MKSINNQLHELEPGCLDGIEEQQIVAALYSLGKYNMAGNIDSIYNIEYSKYEKIKESYYLSGQSRDEELLKHRNSIKEIIVDINKKMSFSEKKAFESVENTRKQEYLEQGIKFLREFLK